MKKLFALFAVLLMLVSTSVIVSPVKAVSSTTIELKQPTYAYKGSTRQIEVKVLNTGTETLNNLWLGVDLIHKTTFDDEEDKIRDTGDGPWATLYSFTFNEIIDSVTVQIMVKFYGGLLNADGQATLRVYWTPTGGSEVQKGSDVLVTQSETSYVVKTLLTDEILGSSGIFRVATTVETFDPPLATKVLTDSCVVTVRRIVEATRTPIIRAGAGDYGGIDFGAQQGLALTSGAARTFATTYTFSRSKAYAYDYNFGAYYWDMAVWKDGYPGQPGSSVVTRTQKSFTIPYSFDITVSLEWNINPSDTSEKGPSFVSQLVSGLRKASNYLFDASDGQMCFKKVTIYDNKEHWDDCDLRIFDSTTQRPHTWMPFGVPRVIEMGRKWIGDGNNGLDPRVVVFDRWDQDQPSASKAAYRILIHEFGHLKLGLLDEYIHGAWGEFLENVLHIQIGMAECFGCLMMWEDSYDEFCNPINHDPDKDTNQEDVNHESCWSTIHRKYPWTYIPMVVDSGPYEDVGKDVSFELGGRSGGPDYFGYTYLDSNSLIGPAYDWIEISGTGTEILPDSDDHWEPSISLGFFFNYYGTDYSLLAIGNNGLLFSGTGTSKYVNDPITQSPSIHGFIAPYWDDLVTWGSAGAIYYQTIGTTPNRKFVVEWYDNQHYSHSTSGITFETILFEGSNNILFQYQDVDFGTVSGSTSGDLPPYNNGGSATVGIEDPTGNIGLQYSFNQQVINSRLAILLKFPAFAGTNMHLSMNSPASMDHGNTMTYTLYYNNFGDATASNVLLQATLSSPLEFVSASDGGTHDSSTREVTWNVGSVAAFPSGRGSRTITVTIPASVSVGTLIQTTASISTDTLETRYDDNSASAQTTVTGSNLPPNVGVGPTVGNSGGTPSVYWTTPITFTYYEPTATSIDIRIHLDDGRPDITGSMTGEPPTWTFTTTFYPRTGHASVTYTVHYPTSDSQVNFKIYVDPAGYIYNVVTLQRISGASVWLQRPDGQGDWENVPTDQNPPIMQPDVNPQTTGADGQYQWDVLEGSYRVHVEAPGYYAADSIVVNIPPPVTDLHVGLTHLPSPDDIPPTTTLTIGDPKYVGSNSNTYVTSDTPFTLSAEDDPGGTGVSFTSYRVFNSSYDSGWTISSPPIEFRLTYLADGTYSIDYFSTDNNANVETKKNATVVLDNTLSGSITINDDATYSNSVSVILTLTSPNVSDVHKIRYSNDGIWDTEQWEDPTLTRTWDLTLRDENKTVYCQIMDRLDLISTTFQASIILDATRPTANAGTDQTVNEDAPVAFDASASTDENGITTYLWTLTDGTPQRLDGKNPIYTFATPGTYIVTLRVTDPAGNDKTSNITITARDATRPVAEAGQDHTVNEDTSITFDGSASSDNVNVTTFTWTFIDGTNQTLNGEITQYTFNTPGAYTVTLNVTDAAGNWATDTVTITVLDVTRPVANAGHDQTVSVGSNVLFDASTSSDNVGIVSYEWDFGDGTTSTGITANHTYTRSGEYTVSLTVRDAANNTDTNQIKVTAESGRTVAIVIAAIAAIIVLTIVATSLILWKKRK